MKTAQSSEPLLRGQWSDRRRGSELSMVASLIAGGRSGKVCSKLRLPARILLLPAREIYGTKLALYL
jgi:hypothetical protein